MKKILFVLLSLLLLTSCGSNTTTNLTQETDLSKNITTYSDTLDPSEIPNEIPEENTIAYSEILNVSGVGPDISFEATIPNDTLALRYTNLEQTYSDHLFIDASLLQKFADNDDLTLPGNKVLFDGEVIWLEGAAGNHYYQVVEINRLEKVANPTKEEVIDLLDSYRYCEADNECSIFYGECPFGCGQAVNTKHLDISQNIIKNWVNNNEPRCVYDCLAIEGVKCEEYKCKAYFTGENSLSQ